jgi:acetolactate synthase-1/3 small subunit
LLATVTVSSRAPALTELVARFEARVIEENADETMVMAVGDTGALDEFEAGLEHFGIVELQRTGRIGLPTLIPAT